MMIKDKATYIMAGIIVILMAVVSMQANTDARKDGEIKLLKEKLDTSESVNQGLKDSVEKLIRYQECTAKIFITPRDQIKAIEGDIDDPVTALERCRIEVNGQPISENPQPPPASTPTNPDSQNQQQGSNDQQPQSPTPEPEQPPDNDGIVTPPILFIPSIHIPSPL